VYNGGSIALFEKLTGAQGDKVSTHTAANVLCFAVIDVLCMTMDTYNTCFWAQVLYVGDHIFSDVVVSKQRHFWRTLLVVRELEKVVLFFALRVCLRILQTSIWQEIHVNLESDELKLHLANLEFIRREAYRVRLCGSALCFVLCCVSVRGCGCAACCQLFTIRKGMDMDSQAPPENIVEVLRVLVTLLDSLWLCFALCS
jgi:hypothetical protein